MKFGSRKYSFLSHNSTFYSICNTNQVIYIEKFKINLIPKPQVKDFNSCFNHLSCRLMLYMVLDCENGIKIRLVKIG